jgi:ATP-dependent helicase/nuclease subunit B
VAARPRRISVTQVETWMRNPYALYARAILKLRPLEPIDADPGAAEKGILIHETLERFVAAHPETLPSDPLGALVTAGEEVFRAVRAKPGLWAFWWPRFLRIAVWFTEAERRRRAHRQRAWSEVRGTLTLDAPAGPFRLTAKADRIDLLADGQLAIIDYKTGALPSTKAVRLSCPWRPPSPPPSAFRACRPARRRGSSTGGSPAASRPARPRSCQAIRPTWRIRPWTACAA